MALRIVGAGLGRTGTLSLKTALERLLGGRCYHMAEVFENPAHMPRWASIARGEPVDWREFFEGYVASVDWPAASFWQAQAEAFPDAIVLLSHRSAESWWKSASGTIFPTVQKAEGPFRDMIEALFCPHFVRDLALLNDRDVCIEAFEAHNARVRAAGLGPRLVEWQAGDGWEPICRALSLPIPEEPFPHRNSTEQFVRGESFERSPGKP